MTQVAQQEAERAKFIVEKAEQDKNPGLKQVAKLCLNSFYGTFGFNVEN